MSLQAVAFVHGHRGSWHNPDVATDLQKLRWDQIEEYTPLSRKYFESFGPWFWTYPGKPERHLQTPIATGKAATNGSFLKHEVSSIEEATALLNRTFALQIQSELLDPSIIKCMLCRLLVACFIRGTAYLPT